MKRVVTMRALLQRINRKLSGEGRKIRTTEGRADRKYFIVDLQRNAVVANNVNPETLGRKLGALEAWETVAK